MEVAKEEGWEGMMVEALMVAVNLEDRGAMVAVAMVGWVEEGLGATVVVEQEEEEKADS